MSRVVKTAVIAIAVLVLIQIATFSAFSRRVLIGEINRNSDQLFKFPHKSTNLAIIYCNLSVPDTSVNIKGIIYNNVNDHKYDYAHISSLNNTEQAEFIKAFRGKFNDVKFVNTESERYEYNRMYEYIKYNVCFDVKTANPTVRVQETIFIGDIDNKAGDPFEMSRTSVYVWVLFAWYKIDEEWTGIS